jgi:hypothetical protein
LRNKRLLANAASKNSPTTLRDKKQRFVGNGTSSLDHDSRTPFQSEYNNASHETMEHRHKIRPVQLFVPSNSNPNALRLNKNALNAVLNNASIANRKVGN